MSGPPQVDWESPNDRLVARAVAEVGLGYISASTTLYVGPGEQFAQPADAADWLAQKLIAPSAKVTIYIAPGTYAQCRQVVGHVHGDRVYWRTAPASLSDRTNAGYTSTRPSIGDFTLRQFVVPAGSNAIAERENFRAQIAQDITANEAMIRSRYSVVLEFSKTTGAPDHAFAARGRHLGHWEPFLAVNVSQMDTGVSTGTGYSPNTGEGAGGVVDMPGACMWNFRRGWVCDYGGIINCNRSIAVGSQEYCYVTDFDGGTIYGHDLIAIGSEYGYRSNHGGELYSDRPVIRLALGSGIEVTNTAGVARAHYCDIQDCAGQGFSASWGGSGKVFGGKIINNLGGEITAGGGCSIDARGVNCQATIPNAAAYSIRSNGGFINCSSTPANISAGTPAYVTMSGGHAFGTNVDGAGVIFVGAAANQATLLDGTFSNARPKAPDSRGWLQELTADDVLRRVGVVTADSAAVTGTTAKTIIRTLYTSGQGELIAGRRLRVVAWLSGALSAGSIVSVTFGSSAAIKAAITMSLAGRARVEFDIWLTGTTVQRGYAETPGFAPAATAGAGNMTAAGALSLAVQPAATADSVVAEVSEVFLV